MLHKRLLHFASRTQRTLLGVGPMSVNCVDAVIDLANTFDTMILLVASRRQIESAAMGGGYVNHWTTEAFADYVVQKDKKAHVILSRDHGGPWQHEQEKAQKLSLRQAMASAKESFRVDIESGMEIIHIDTSIDIHGTPSSDEMLLRVFELYEYCWEVARQNKKNIVFEIGTEEQTGGTQSGEDLFKLFSEMKRFCTTNRLPLPVFIVIQVGTRVMETGNIGSFESPQRIDHELPAEIQIPRMVEICNRNGIFIKAHNTDYLSDEALSWYPKLGIHAANVAPEFGVLETRGFLGLLAERGLTEQREAFLELAYHSGKWKKWLLPDSRATDEERAIIAGHYVFSDPHFLAIKHKAQERIADLLIDDYLKDLLKANLMRYLKLFRLLRTA
ncbi:MAG: class II D-tagatose-bisphosphate aldolase, non-catalytic subunit [Magnetococcales bacterium]|nr:class II D-tagatose-bisphosphate aldolase, non-catalytic subunit [Magnetococcales bacterium]